jgi:hypothetical protein
MANLDSGATLRVDLRIQGDSWEKRETTIEDQLIQFSNSPSGDGNVEFGTGFEGIINSIEIYTGAVEALDPQKTFAGKFNFNPYLL